MALTITVLIRRIASNLTTTQFRIAALHRAGGMEAEGYGDLLPSSMSRGGRRTCDDKQA